MEKTTYKKFSREDQRALATWATECAERVLPLFEQVRPQDDRPRQAIASCREWVRTGVFAMATIRGVSLSAHAAAREVREENDAACFAARAAGQAVATAHVTQHAYGGAYYALKSIAASDPAHAEANVKTELEWQAGRLPGHLREEVMGRIIVGKGRGGVVMRVRKGRGY